MSDQERSPEKDAACIFCRIVAGESPAEWAYTGPTVVAFHPLNPVTPGHVLVVPRAHVEDYTESPSVTGETVRIAATLARHFQSNLITSAGAAATQTVRHLHFHIVPRRDGDGLHLPWTGQDTRPLPPGEDQGPR